MMTLCRRPRQSAEVLHPPTGMWSLLGAGVDLLHALAMAAWLVGLPLLFVRRWPKARLAYAAFAIFFVVTSQISMIFLDECFLTTIARFFWERAPSHVASHEWFTVRLANAVFGMAPSHRAISRISEALILVTAAGVVVSVLRGRRTPFVRRQSAHVEASSTTR